MKKIMIFESKDFVERAIKKKLKSVKDVEVKYTNEELNKENASMASDCDIISVFIYSDLSKEVLDQLPKLKMISTRSTGFDHIDISEAKKRKISVSNVPRYGENTVAEHTMGLVLSLSRNIHKSYVRSMNDDFSNIGLTGFDLKDKTIGIIGGGHIGLHVARMAKAFGMHVRVFDIKEDDFLAEVIGFKYVSMNDLLKISDIVSIHAPLNKHTKHLMNKQAFQKMKKGSLLINTARGEIVDTEALEWALRTEVLAGAGLDVLEGEELIKEDSALLQVNKSKETIKRLFIDQKILKMDNVVFTPHNAFNSKEAIMRILTTTVNNIKGFIEDKPLNDVESN